MSLNSFLPYKSSLYKDKIREVLQTIYHPDKAVFLEQKQSYLDMLERISEDPLSLFSYSNVNFQDRLTKENFLTSINTTYIYMYLINKLITEFFAEYTKVQRQENSLLNDLGSAKSLLEQKISSLNLIRGDILYAFSEHFLTLSNIETSLTTLNISGGVATLPIAQTNQVPIKSLAISNGSVGSLGSTDPNYPSSPDLSKFLLEETDFQYEEFDDSKAIAILQLDIDGSKIINGIRITSKPIDSVLTCVCTSIRAYYNGSEIELLNEDSLEISPEGILIPFYPIVSDRIFITLVQSQGYPLSLGRSSNATRKVIALSSIELLAIKYSSSGAATSNSIPVSRNPNASQVILNVSKTNENLYTSQLIYSLDKGKSWLSSDTLGSASKITDLYWKILLERNDGSFQNNSSVLEVETDYDYYSQLEYVSGLKSPASFILNKPSLSDQITVMQPRVMRKAGRRRELKIGDGTGEELRIKLSLPITIEDAVGATLRVNGKIWQYVNTLSGQTSTAEVWSLDKTNYTYIVFGDGTEGKTPSDKSVITFSLELEELSFTQTTDGYESVLNHPFDPDKDNIQVQYVSETETNIKVVLERDQSIFYFPYTNLVDGSFTVTEKTISGLTYSSPIASTEVDFNDGDFTLTAGQYTVDYLNGVLYLYQTIPNDDILTVSFKYYPTKIIDKDGFDVIFNASIPIGLRVKRDVFPAKSVVDTIGDILTRLTPNGLSTETRTVADAGDTAFVFSRKYPVRGTVNVSNLFENTSDFPPEELEYIDGHSEFHGLIHVLSEKTSAIAGEDTIVTFTISAGTSYYAPLGISFEDTDIFSNEVLFTPTAIGEWFVNPVTGQISVWVADGLPSSINYSYYYEDRSFDPTNKFSVNYSRGVLHSKSSFKSEGSISYKSGNFFVGYDMALLVSDFEFNKDTSILSVRTEDKFNYSKLIKIIYPIRLSSLSLEEIKEYYSPLLSSIDFRFS